MLRAIIFCSLSPLVFSDCGNFSEDNEDSVCYEIATEASNWIEARDICHSLGAEVASIHNQQENSFIRRLAVSNGALNGVFLGGALSGKGYKFTWIDGSDWDYANYRPGYPIEGLGECLAMDTTTTAGQWINKDCDAALPVVCARAPVAAPTSEPDPPPISEQDPRYAAFKDVTDLLGSWMNTSFDPCDDFYSFTCGAGKSGQETLSEIAENDAADTMLRQLNKPAAFFDSSPLPLRQMKWFYDACLVRTPQSAWLAQSTKIFNDLRAANPGFGFPALFPAETNAPTPDQLAAFLGYSLGTAGTASLVPVGVETDWRDPHNSNGGYALFVDQPAPLNMDYFYAKVYDRQSMIDNMVYTINAAAKLLGIKNLDQRQVQNDAEDMADFDYDLATKYSTDDVTRRQHARNYNPKTVDELEQFAPFLNWKTFFNKALTPISKTVDGSFRSIVMEVEKLALVSDAITTWSIRPRTLNNYLYLRVLDTLTLPIPDPIGKKSRHQTEFRRQTRTFNSGIRREQIVDPRKMVLDKEDHSFAELRCQMMSSTYFLWASNRLFVDAKYPDVEGKQKVKDQANAIVSSITAALRSQIDLLDWMTPESKKGAYQKIDNLVVNIAYPDWVLDDGELTSYYKMLDTNKSETYIDQFYKMKAFFFYEAFSPLINGAAADRTNFGGPASIANVWYQPQLNSLTIAGAIVDTPFYDYGFPAAINYGALGYITGKELSQAFDEDGMQWEGTGILNSWMDSNSTAEFYRMAQCEVQEYSKFCPINGPISCVDGTQTEPSNVADNAGIQTAYKAFKSFESVNGPDPRLPGAASVYNADQLFFLGFAQVLCQYPSSQESLLTQIISNPQPPSKYRVLGTLQNFPEFQKAFNCPVGSTYAPKDHCDAWTAGPTSGASSFKKFGKN